MFGPGMPEILVFLLIVPAYLLPFIIAWARGHSKKAILGLMNILAGCTALGWLARLVWAFIDNREEIEIEPLR
jgi:hypothetical protein